MPSCPSRHVFVLSLCSLQPSLTQLCDIIVFYCSLKLKRFALLFFSLSDFSNPHIVSRSLCFLLDFQLFKAAPVAFIFTVTIHSPLLHTTPTHTSEQQQQKQQQQQPHQNTSKSSSNINLRRERSSTEKCLQSCQFFPSRPSPSSPPRPTPT